MKAKDIYNAYLYNNPKYEMYLLVNDMNLLDKSIKLTGKGKKYEGSADAFCLSRRAELKCNWKSQPCDIVFDDRWFINLRDRGYNISNVDIIKQFEFDNFKVEDGKLIFVFHLNKDEIDKYWDDYWDLRNNL